ncbi:vegetative cell wall protein gp1-like [Plutella xylostella]|uniref:vegetative cell wall protein gp1-like n=1 Tax=Plutella xylostella TaxID=51655 RepID=UPI002032AE71|nr:vegetative cell wall protein gp1-like [Plutella xylostella]
MTRPGDPARPAPPARPDFSSYYQSGGCAVTSHARPAPPVLLRRPTFVSVYSAVGAPAAPRCCCEQCASLACPVRATPPAPGGGERPAGEAPSAAPPAPPALPTACMGSTLCADPACPAQTRNIPRCLFPPDPPEPRLQARPPVVVVKESPVPEPAPPQGTCSSGCAGQRAASDDSAEEEDEEPTCAPTCRFYREPGQEPEPLDEPTEYTRRPRRKKKKKPAAPRCWSTPRRGGTGGRAAACPQCALLRHRELPYGPRPPSRYHRDCGREHTGPSSCALHGPDGGRGGRGGRGATACPRPRECGRGPRRVLPSRDLDQDDGNRSKDCSCKRNRK